MKHKIGNRIACLCSEPIGAGYDIYWVKISEQVGPFLYDNVELVVIVAVIISYHSYLMRFPEFINVFLSERWAIGVYQALLFPPV